MRVIISGGTGFIGTALTKMLLERGCVVHILTRQTQKIPIPGVQYFTWDPINKVFPLDSLNGVKYIFNLAGAGIVDKHWTKKFKREIVTSRISSGKLISEILNTNPNEVEGVLSASAIGWYGEDKPGYTFRETDPNADDFIGNVCKDWEDSVSSIQHIPVCKVRFGIVFGREAGAFPKFIAPLKYGLAAILGNGKQVMSWIHKEDICRLMIYAMDKKLSGIYNGVAPMPVTNRFLTIEISHRIRKNSFLPIYVPSFILRLNLGQSTKEILKSTTVSSEKIVNTGFTFLYPSLKAALDNLIEVKDPS